jgi:uncharacterized membrane protein YdbT with pleckstrin-like domain
VESDGSVRESIGELKGLVRGMEGRLTTMELSAREGFARIEATLATHISGIAATLRAHDQRIGTQERWQAWVWGSLAALALAGTLFGWYLTTTRVPGTFPRDRPSLEAPP